MDIKLPSATGLGQGSWQEHRDFLKIATAKEVFIKVVVTDSSNRQEFISALEVLKDAGYAGIVVLQPDSSSAKRKLGNNAGVF